VLVLLLLLLVSLVVVPLEAVGSAQELHPPLVVGQQVDFLKYSIEHQHYQHRHLGLQVQRRLQPLLLVAERFHLDFRYFHLMPSFLQRAPVSAGAPLPISIVGRK